MTTLIALPTMTYSEEKERISFLDSPDISKIVEDHSMLSYFLYKKVKALAYGFVYTDVYWSEEKVIYGTIQHAVYDENIIRLDIAGYSHVKLLKFLEGNRYIKQAILYISKEVSSCFTYSSSKVKLCQI